MTGSAWWARPGIPWSHTLGLILSSHSFWPLSIEGVMGSSVVTRSCRALGAEKLPITRVVPSLVSISLPNKGLGHSGTTRNWWENICPSQQQRSSGMPHHPIPEVLGTGTVKKTQCRGSDKEPRLLETGTAKTNSAESSSGPVSDSRRPPVKVRDPRSYGWRDLYNLLFLVSLNLPQTGGWQGHN